MFIDKMPSLSDQFISMSKDYEEHAQPNRSRLKSSSSASAGGGAGFTSAGLAAGFPAGAGVSFLPAAGAEGAPEPPTDPTLDSPLAMS